ncbi:MAG: hypothetical protein RR846_07570 [Oscillospiraceae bacterium]
MAKQFYIKGTNRKWVNLTGQEFYIFVNNFENQNRYFYDFQDYILEVSKEKFEEYTKEKNHADYLKRLSKSYQTMSIDSDLITEFGCGEEVISNNEEDIADILFKNLRSKALRKTLSLLPLDEYQLISDIYLKENKKTEQQIAEKNGLSQKAINKRKNKILRDLYFSVLKFEKSQQ